MQFFEKNYRDQYLAFSAQAKPYSYEFTFITFLFFAPILFFGLNYFEENTNFQFFLKTFSYIFTGICVLVICFVFMPNEKFVESSAEKYIKKNMQRKKYRNAFTDAITSPDTLFFYGSTAVLYYADFKFCFCIALIACFIELGYSIRFTPLIENEIGKQFSEKTENK